jgi:hypothetical protein
VQKLVGKLRVAHLFQEGIGIVFWQEVSGLPASANWPEHGHHFLADDVSETVHKLELVALQAVQHLKATTSTLKRKSCCAQR